MTKEQLQLQARIQLRKVAVLERKLSTIVFQQLLKRRDLAIQAYLDSSSAVHTEATLGNTDSWRLVLERVYWVAVEKKSFDSLSSWVRNKAQKVAEGLAAYEKRMVRELISKFRALNKSIEFIVSEITRMFLWKSGRALRILRTELHAAINANTFITGRVLGAKLKSWISVLDGRERSTHSQAHFTQVDVPFREPFQVGSSELMFPGDTSLGASLSEIVNCRCILVVHYR